jgi:hypothetical protein
MSSLRKVKKTLKIVTLSLRCTEPRWLSIAVRLRLFSQQSQGLHGSLVTYFYFLLDEKVTKNQGKTILPPALPNRKPYGDVSDMKRSRGLSCQQQSLAYDSSKPYIFVIGAFHIERKRPHS